MWERGEARPGRHYRQGLTAFTGLGETELGLGLTSYIVGDANPAREEEDTKRREMISSMVAAGMALWQPGRQPVMTTHTVESTSIRTRGHTGVTRRSTG
jgi:hypothetical protein